MNKGDFTITSTNFTYYLNTKAENTIAYGPGLLHCNLVGHDTVFLIQARNTKGDNRESGSDIFHVKITGEPKFEQNEEGEEIEIAKEFPFEITDLDNGSYQIKFKVEEEVSNLKVDIKYENEKGELVPIRGNPYSSSFKEGVNLKNNELTGPALISYITNSLAETEKFITDSRNNINIKNKDISDVKELLEVKENLGLIDEKKDEILLTIDIIEQCLKMLAKYDIPKDSELSRTKKSKEEWFNLQKMAVTVEKDISNPVKTEAAKTNENLQKFEESLKEHFLGMRKKGYYVYDTGVEGANGLLEKQNEEIEEFRLRLKDFEYFSKMFDFQDKVQGSQKNLEQIKNEAIGVEKLWKHIDACQQQFENYLEMKWVDVNPMDMEDDVKKLKKKLLEQKGIDKKSNVFQGINETIKKWITFLPLLGDLKDPAMTVDDGRHWDKVVKIVKKEFEISEELLLDTIWNLKLFEFKEAIEDVAEQAKNESKMEKGLKSVIEAWRTIDFEFHQHKETKVNTLKMSEDNFELLEQHQLEVNNMLLSKYVAFFETEVETWKQDLGSIYDVIQLLIDVQKSWSFLENLFIHSEEVQKELPNESEKFVGIDESMKEIMANGCEIKNILKFCTQEGMIKNLEVIESNLKICEKALNEFLDGKRRAFPRFYFVSVADLLDVLSNGNNPHNVNKHMPKIFQAIDHLELEGGGDGNRPTAKGFKTCVGSEDIVTFKNPLNLVGKVEVYLQDVIESMRETLKNNAVTSLEFNKTNSREDWIKRDAAQITLLINMITTVARIEESFGKISTGQMNAMSKSFEDTKDMLIKLIEMVQGKLSKADR